MTLVIKTRRSLFFVITCSEFPMHSLASHADSPQKRETVTILVEGMGSHANTDVGIRDLTQAPGSGPSCCDLPESHLCLTQRVLALRV